MRKILDEMHAWMSNYMKSFYTDNEEVQNGILIKEKHTGYVTANSVELAKYLNLNQHDVELAEIIGLFHDVGRFRQYSIYKTFNDADSEDHADLGMKVICELDFFNKISRADFEIAKFAIQQHNKKEIAAIDDERKILFAKIIRDADKLDIYRVLEPYFDYKNAAKMPNFIKGKFIEDISDDFVEHFAKGEQADYREIRTNGDRKIVRLMWVYNVNFAWTLKKISERGFIDKIIENLPRNENNSARIDEGIARLREYVAKRISE